MVHFQSTAHTEALRKDRQTMGRAPSMGPASRPGTGANPGRNPDPAPQHPDRRISPFSGEPGTISQQPRDLGPPGLNPTANPRRPDTGQHHTPRDPATAPHRPWMPGSRTRQSSSSSPILSSPPASRTLKQSCWRKTPPGSPADYKGSWKNPSPAPRARTRTRGTCANSPAPRRRRIAGSGPNRKPGCSTPRANRKGRTAWLTGTRQGPES